MAKSHIGRGMEKVVIIINADVSDRGEIIAASPVTQKMVEALQRSIGSESSSRTVEIVSAATLWSRNNKVIDKEKKADGIYCPLTIQLPEYFDFPQRKVFSACKDINSRRRWVEKNLGFKTSVGDSWLGHLWLPIRYDGQTSVWRSYWRRFYAQLLRTSRSNSPATTKVST